MKRIFAILSLSALAGCAHKPGKSVPLTQVAATSIEQEMFSDLPRDAALRLARSRRDGILEKLSPPPDPYYGAIDPGPTCNAKNRPVPREDLSSSDFRIEMQLYASAGHLYGLCRPEADQLRSRIAWIYCSQSKTLSEIREFFPLTAAWKTEPLKTNCAGL